jgi:hypothetical protein
MIDTPISSIASQNARSINDASSQHTANSAPVYLQNPSQTLDLGNMSVQQIADRLEKQRINELKNAAMGMKGTLV